MPVDDPVIKAVKGGHPAIMVTGNYHDLMIAEDKIVYRPSFLPQLLSQDFAVIRFSRSRGITLPDFKQFDSETAKEAQTRLRNTSLIGNVARQRSGAGEEVINFFRAIQRLLTTSATNRVRFAVLIDYTEHLAPSVQTAAAATDDHIIVAETIHSLGLSPSLRKSGNVLICVVREGLQHPLLNELHKVSYGYPTQEITEDYFRLAMNKKSANGEPYYAELADGFDISECARIFQGLPLRLADEMLLEAKS